MVNKAANIGKANDIMHSRNSFLLSIFIKLFCPSSHPHLLSSNIHTWNNHSPKTNMFFFVLSLPLYLFLKIHIISSVYLGKINPCPYGLTMFSAFRRAVPAYDLTVFQIIYVFVNAIP